MIFLDCAIKNFYSPHGYVKCVFVKVVTIYKCLTVPASLLPQLLILKDSEISCKLYFLIAILRIGKIHLLEVRKFKI